MNVFTASGYLGRDAEVRHTQQGTALTSFSVPVDTGYGDKKETMWVKCTLWGRKGTGEAHGLSPYLLKGKFVVVTGEASLQSWTTKEGETKTDLCISVKDVSLGGGGDKKPAQTQAPKAEAVEEFIDDDVPF